MFQLQVEGWTDGDTELPVAVFLPVVSNKDSCACSAGRNGRQGYWGQEGMFKKLRCCCCYAGLGHHLQKCRCQKLLVGYYPVHTCVARLCGWSCQFVSIIICIFVQICGQKTGSLRSYHLKISHECTICCSLVKFKWLTFGHPQGKKSLQDGRRVLKNRITVNHAFSIMQCMHAAMQCY